MEWRSRPLVVTRGGGMLCLTATHAERTTRSGRIEAREIWPVRILETWPRNS